MCVYSVGQLTVGYYQVKVSMEAVDGICHKLQQTHFLRGSGGARGPAVKK